MSELTPEQQLKLNALEDEFSEILKEIRPSLSRLAELSEFEPSDEVIKYSEIALNTFDAFWKREDFANTQQDDINWFASLLGYFITVLLINRYGGFLQPQSDPEEKYFLRYVVSSFERGIPAKTIIDPFELALEYTRLPPGRSLIKQIDEACRVKPEGDKT